ncbi:Guanylate cyclase 2G [Nowakowskiella sp. JEL0407]|nr:Guanylate cyclase 2G [Nowakowskiella sp. JEL0407]
MSEGRRLKPKSDKQLSLPNGEKQSPRTLKPKPRSKSESTNSNPSQQLSGNNSTNTNNFNNFNNRNESTEDGEKPNTSTELSAAVNNETVFDNLRGEFWTAEDARRDAEKQVMLLEQEAFLLQQHDQEMSDLINRQKDEDRTKAERFARSTEREDIANENRNIQEQVTWQNKFRDATISHQEHIKRLVARMKEDMAARRQKHMDQLKFVETRHKKVRNQMLAAQDRVLAFEKLLHEFESRKYAQQAEVQAVMERKFNNRMQHQKIIDKAAAEQQHTEQLLEIRQLKERVELEDRLYGEIQQLKKTQQVRYFQLQMQQKHERNEQRHLLSEMVDSHRKNDRKKHQHKVLKKLSIDHKNQLTLLKQQQDEQVRALRAKIYSAHEGEDINLSVMHLVSTTRNLSTSNSLDSLPSTDGTESIFKSNASRRSASEYRQSSVTSNNSNKVSSYAQESVFDDGELEQEHEASAEITQMQENLRRLRERHNQDLKALKQNQKAEMERSQDQAIVKISELEEEHAEEMMNMKNSHERQMEELLAVQSREMEMEATVHDAEVNMLLERQVLSSVLQTVNDAIIMIDVSGTIQKWNKAAEILFGFTEADILGRNITAIIPDEHAVNHDQYIMNYRVTGIKKVIGLHRRLTAKRRDGTFVPIQLSLSEVKEGDVHMFTGIIHDLTEEDRIAELQRASDQLKRVELETFAQTLEVTKSKINNLVQQLLPPSISAQLMETGRVLPQEFESCTIFFSDICGFTTICSKSTPIQTVNMLNQLYTTFDEIIAKYDAYKVETIGDAYLVVSGVPIKNGKKHAEQIATMALHLLSAVDKLKLKDNPDAQIRIRIGIATGPAVAGVVGQKMPRYCLFGNTVNIASRMESSGEPMRIQVTDETAKALRQSGCFNLSYRGELSVKGEKNKIRTYWLDSKTGFEHNLEDKVSLKSKTETLKRAHSEKKAEIIVSSRSTSIYEVDPNVRSMSAVEELERPHANYLAAPLASRLGQLRTNSQTGLYTPRAFSHADYGSSHEISQLQQQDSQKEIKEVD